MSRKRRQYGPHKPANRTVRGQPMPNKSDAPWYGKQALSRPESKRRRQAEVT